MERKEIAILSMIVIVAGVLMYLVWNQGGPKVYPIPEPVPFPSSQKEMQTPMKEGVPLEVWEQNVKQGEGPKG